MYGAGGGGGGDKPGSGSGGSTYLRNLGLPAQVSKGERGVVRVYESTGFSLHNGTHTPQLSLLVADVAVAVNFVVALLVPWVEARYRVANVWFPVYVPIKVCYVYVCVGSWLFVIA